MGEGGGSGLDYLKSVVGVFDQWHIILGILTLMTMTLTTKYVSMGDFKYHEGPLAWDVIVGLFVVLSLILFILKIVGVNLPKLVLVIYYFVAGIIVLLTALLVYFVGDCDHKAGCRLTALQLCLTVGMGILYIYSGVLALGGESGGGGGNGKA